MKIFIDFDRVAFNTDRLYELLDSEGAPEAGTIESLDYLYPTDSEPKEDLVYDDFKLFATQQKELGNEIIIVSSAQGFSGEWDFAYHREKIKRSGVTEFAEVVPVEGGKVEAIRERLSEGERAVFIDDSPKHLSEVHRLNTEDHAILCIHMVRDGKHRTATGLEKIERMDDFASTESFEGVKTLIEEQEKE